MTIKLNEPIEVTPYQYIDIVNRLGGIVAHRKANGKFFVKLWDINYKRHLLKLLQ